MDVDAEGPGRLCFTSSDQYDEYFHINFGKRLIGADPSSVYCGIFESGPTVRIVAYAGKKAPRGADAGAIAREVSAVLGGSGGGNAEFAQGGGKDTSKKDEAIGKARSMVLGRQR